MSNSELHVTSTSNVEHRKIECKTALTLQLYILFLVMVFVSVSVSVLGKGTQKCGKVWSLPNPPRTPLPLPVWSSFSRKKRHFFVYFPNLCVGPILDLCAQTGKTVTQQFRYSLHICFAIGFSVNTSFEKQTNSVGVLQKLNICEDLHVSHQTIITRQHQHSFPGIQFVRRYEKRRQKGWPKRTNDAFLQKKSKRADGK